MLMVLLSMTAMGQVVRDGRKSSDPNDSSFAKRKVERPDSLNIPYDRHGRLSVLDPVPQFDITKRDTRHIQYRSLPELLTRSTPWMALSAGGFGQYNSLSIAGGTGNDLAVSMNGRALYEPWSGSLHLEQVAVEGLERMELYVGSDAIGLAPSSTLAVLNLQEIRHNIATPFTRLWYTQGAGDLIAADVSLAQNVARDLNVAVGVRRSGANGSYARTGFDVWNVRAAVRYTATERLHLSLSYNLASLNTDLWGGILPGSASMTDDFALPRYATLHDESRRHDVTLSSTLITPGDSTGLVSISAYLSTMDMLRLRDSTGAVLHGRTMGAIGRFERSFGPLLIRSGVVIEHASQERTIYTSAYDGVTTGIFGHARLRLGEIDVSAAARLSRSALDSLVSGAGALLLWRAAADWSVSADLSTIGTSIRQTLAMATLTWHHEKNAATIIGYHRITDATSQTASGIVGQGTARIGAFEVRPVLRIQRSTTSGINDEWLPLVSGHVSVAYVYEVGTSNVSLGITAGGFSPMRPMQYDPLTWSYLPGSTKQNWVGNGLDGFLAATLGNATVRLSWENLLQQRYATTELSPEAQRNLRFTLNWSFFD